MKYSGNLSGSSPVMKKYKSSATTLLPGIVGLRSAANASGQVSISTTTSFGDALGIILDNGEKFGATTAYSTTQGAVEGVVTVIVNPDQILRAKMVTGATGTSITADTVVTAVTNGLTVVGGTSVASPDMDEGILWFTSGGNLNESRKITSTSSVTATVLVPFPRTSAVGDTYCYAGLNVGLTGVTLTTDLKSVRTDIAIATGASATILDFDLAGTTDSFVYLVLGDQVWTNAT
jgi:hypothetical protein